MKNRIGIIIAGLAGVYLLTYFTLSACGTYRDEGLVTGQRYAVWQPALCCWTKSLRHGKTAYGLTTVGKVFLPLALLDRHLIHKTKLLISVQGDGQVLARISEDGKRIEQIAEQYK